MKRITNLLGLVTREKPKVAQTPSDVAYAENKWRLLHYRPRAGGLAHQAPILLVPSLINRHYVLDLMPGKSFTEYLVQAGWDVWCIDWGTPGDEDRFTTFDDIVDTALGRAIRRVAATSPLRKTHVLGYCMGGTLAAIHGAVHPEHIASLVALAAPVRFKDESLLSKWTNSKTFDVNAVVDALGTVPASLLQSAFHLLRPTLGLSKAVTLLDRAWNDEFLDGFLALEKWGNDNVSLPGEFYRRYIGALYREDGLLAGAFSLSGRQVDLKRITFPTLAVTFEHDNIVPAESGRVLLDVIGSKEKEHLHLPGGHVGAVVSKHAGKTLWPQLDAYFAKHDRGEDEAVTPKAPLKVAERTAPKAEPKKPSTPAKPRGPAAAPPGR